MTCLKPFAFVYHDKTPRHSDDYKITLLVHGVIHDMKSLLEWCYSIISSTSPFSSITEEVIYHS